ncbi:hypothetical protein NDU88_000995 [Pleurodeles waltl]|uniref:Uncharacterized protein n=1 Tax=Pleurodeles waltl TaxID=8319 RepID=A0AAV7VVN9_PLEWA|nr:hypothetical protein NDU88_000995 [Pleurodeles waltl]
MTSQPGGEGKAGPRAASQMASLKKAGTWAGRAKEVFSGPCDGRGSEPADVAAPKRQRPTPTEWHRGHNAAPRRTPQEDVEWHSDTCHGEAQGAHASGMVPLDSSRKERAVSIRFIFSPLFLGRHLTCENIFR